MGYKEYVKNWAKVLTQSLTSTHPKVPAGKLYVGRSITEIEKSCMNLSASCYFISGYILGLSQQKGTFPLTMLVLLEKILI